MAEIVEQGLALPVAVQIAIIAANCIIRLAAIAGGIYVAKLGHDTMVRDIKGEITYKGGLGTLKASIPGPLFILLGVGAIGWALASPVEGSFEIRAGVEETLPSQDADPRDLPFPRPKE